MAQTINTVTRILYTLNGNSNVGPWAVLPGFYSINTVTGVGTSNLVFNPGEGLILKAFLNSSTGEVRCYVAKFLDEGQSIP